MIALIVFIVLILGLSLGLWSMNSADDANADSLTNEDLNGIDSSTDLGDTLDNLEGPSP